MFSARLINHNTTQMLNICDLDLLGKTLTRDKLSIKIDEKYYGEKTINKEKATELLKNCNSINLVGNEIISLSTSLGIGSIEGIKKINDIPFLIVFKV